MKFRIVRTAALFHVILIFALSMGSCGQPIPIFTEEPAPSLIQTADTEDTVKPADLPGLPGKLDISIGDAALIALEYNRGISLRRLDTLSSKLDERIARSEFDPEASASVTGGRNDSVSAGTDYTEDTLDTSASVSQKFSSGTAVDVEFDTSFSDSTLNTSSDASTRIGVSVTQSLMQGAGTAVNRAEIMQAEIDTDISKHQLKGYAEYLVSAVEKTYWDLALARSRITIYEESLALAQKQKEETSEKIEAGQLPEIELAAARAEVALRKEDLINAKSRAAVTRLRLLQILNPRDKINWDGEITLKDIPEAADVDLGPVEDRVKTALEARSDLNQAELEQGKGILEVQRTRNGILPKLDLFVNLGTTGYADSFSDSIKGMNDGHYDAEIGLRFRYPSLSGSPRSEYEKARISSRTASLALENMKDVVQFDVRSAYIEVTRAREQVAATAATRKALDEKFNAEKVKFDMGKSTTLLVAQVQRDSVAGRIAEIESIVNYLDALINFYLAEGTLLQRRGITLKQ